LAYVWRDHTRAGIGGSISRRLKEAKAKKSILETLLRDLQGTPAERLALFERLKGAGAVVNEPVVGLAEAETALRGLAAMEKGSERACGGALRH
jgi:hypothetical protein